MGGRRTGGWLPKLLLSRGGRGWKGHSSRVGGPPTLLSLLLFPRMQNTKNFRKGRRRKVPPPNTFFEKEENIAPSSLSPYPRRLLHPALLGRKDIYLGIEFPIRCGKSSVALYRLRRVEKGGGGGGCIGYQSGSEERVQSSSHFYVSERPVFLGEKRGCDCLFSLPPPSFESGYRKEEIFLSGEAAADDDANLPHLFLYTGERETTQTGC